MVTHDWLQRLSTQNTCIIHYEDPVSLSTVLLSHNFKTFLSEFKAGHRSADVIKYVCTHILQLAVGCRLLGRALHRKKGK